MNIKPFFALPLIILLPLLGCSSTPTAAERAVFDVQTNYVPKLVLLTNVIPVFVTNTVVNTVTVTNTQGVVVPIFVTNITSTVTFQTNQVMATNLVPVYTETIKTNTTATVGAVGSVVDIFAPGTGGLVTSGILAALSIFLGYRNRQFAGKNDALSQSAGVLAQIIETGREVMAKTPQGQQAANAFTQWMVTHQADTNTIGQITQIVKSTTDNSEAQRAADQILALIGQAPPPTPKA